jgi:nitrogen regulatory protein PII
MRMLLVVTEPEAVREMERSLLAAGHNGFTVVPNAWGSGRTGLHTGDRVHPGGTSVLFSVVPDEAVEGVVAAIRQARDRAGAGQVTRIFSVPAEEVG